MDEPEDLNTHESKDVYDRVLKEVDDLCVEIEKKVFPLLIEKKFDDAKRVLECIIEERNRK